MHGLWPQAVALGYRVIIKPSEREPFTAQRLVASLRLAGLYDYVAFIPCAHKSVETLVEASDLSLIYGSEATVERYKALVVQRLLLVQTSSHRMLYH